MQKEWMAMRLTIALLIFTMLFFSTNSYSYDEYYDEVDSSYSYHDNYDDGYQARNNDAEYYDDEPSYRPHRKSQTQYSRVYSSRLPTHIVPPGEKVIVVNPRKHAFGAYDAKGNLVRTGLATAGGSWCRDIHKPCRTTMGIFRIKSLGDSDCISSKFPVGEGGAPMPYCMFFNGGQGIHGSYQVVDANVSHGCVRVHVEDAEWLRYNFANVGTKVVIMPY